MFFLALSCLQGRPMGRAFEDLAALEPAGVQLTPGNMPCESFPDLLAASSLALRTHHGFTATAWKSRVIWSDEGACAVTSHSLHPPAAGSPAAARFLDWCEAAPAPPVLETMYPGYALGDGPAIEEAMRRRLALAVDVSHLHIQRAQGLLGAQALARLLDYERIAEVHVSANDGRSDQHRPLDERSFGLDWARARGRAGTPVILECYFHRLSSDERRSQIDLVRQ